MATVERCESCGGPGKFIVITAIIAFAVIVLLQLTQHLGEIRPGTNQTRLEIWQRIESRLNNRHNDDGNEYYASACFDSTVKNPLSKYFGEPNPHYKVAVCNSGSGRCDYAIIGMLFDEPAVVTTRNGISKHAFHAECRRDGCITVPVDEVMNIIYAIGVP